MAVTIREVARVAGVSVATVSRALNDSGPVRPATRARVLRIAEELSYTPNMAARSLTTRRTGVVGVLLPDLFGEFFSELIRGLDETAQSLGYHLFLSSSHDNAGEIRTALQGMRARVDGLILMVPAVPPGMLHALLPRNLPIVLLSSPAVAHENYHSLMVDNAGGARAVVTHLVGHGHRRIGMLLGPAGNHDAEERRRGYRAALKDAGLGLDPLLEVPGDFTGAAGYAAVLRLRELATPPTAIFAANDALALGALSALRELQIAVPDAVAVAGFDNISSTQYSVPPLTTVEVSINELGARAVRRVVSALKNGRETTSEWEELPAKVVIRRSCGCGT